MTRNQRFDHGGATMAVAAVILAMFLQNGRAQTTNTDGSSSNPDTYCTPSMIIILVIFIVVVVLMSFLPVYIRNATATRGTLSPVGIIDLASHRGQRGLDPAILCKFPTFTYSEVKSHKVVKGVLECAVCLTEFADEETLKLLPKCDHVFHPDCIDVWLASHSTCPVCRASLEKAPEVTRNVQTDLEPSVFESSIHEAISEIPELLRSISTTISKPEAVERSKSCNHPRPWPMPMRSLSMKFSLFFSKFPRSNSTGHFVVEPGENIDRFTLKLPSEIRNQITNRMLNRSAGVVVLPTESSFRKGYRAAAGGGEGRVIRWTKFGFKLHEFSF